MTSGTQHGLFGAAALASVVVGGAMVLAVSAAPSAPMAQFAGKWERVPSPSTADLSAIDMLASDAGWAVGDGPILKWDGSTWSKDPTSGERDFDAVDMVSENEGWAVGGSDSARWDGASWTAHEDLGWLSGVLVAQGGARVWASGSKPGADRFGFPRLMITEWKYGAWLEMQVPDLDGRLLAMDGGYTAWAVGTGDLGHGITLYWNGSYWRQIDNPTTGIPTTWLYDVAVAASNDVWTVGSDGQILHWNGRDWIDWSSPTDESLQGIDMVAADMGFAVGSAGTILRWDGAAWMKMASPVTQTLTAISMLSHAEGWAVGVDGTILHYTDPRAPTATLTPVPATAAPTATAGPATATPATTPTASATPGVHEADTPSLAVAVNGTHAYLGVGQWVDVLDVSDPTDPRLVGRSELLGNTVWDIALGDGRAYVALGAGGIAALDISDPDTPVRLGSFKGIGSTYDLVAGSGHAFILDETEAGDALRSVDFTDPMHPVERDSYDIARAEDVAISGRTVFVGASAGYEGEPKFLLYRFNASTPSNMRMEGSHEGKNAYGDEVTVGDGHAYAGLVHQATFMASYDVSGFTGVESLGYVDLEAVGWQPGWADVNDMIYHDDHVFVTGDYTRIVPPDIPTYRYLKVVNVSDPASPKLVGFGTGGVHGLAAAGTHLFGSMGSSGGMYVYDLADPAKPKTIGSYYPAKLDAVTPRPTRAVTPTPTSVPSATAPVRACTGPEWTALVYLNGDNNLESHLLQLFNTLEEAAGNPCVQIRALWDGRAQGDSALYDVLPDSNPFVLAAYQDGVNRWPKGELNMGDPQTLIDFARQGYADLPNPHRFLAIVDHGNGWSPNLAAGPAQFTHAGISFDDSSGPGAYLSTSALANAFGVITQNGQQQLDVVFYDACLMAMIENAYPLRPFVRYLVASQNETFTSYPYDDYFDAIHAGTEASDLATAMVDRYHDSLTGFPRTIAALDLAQIERLAREVDDLAKALGTQLDARRLALLEAFKSAQKFDSNVDLRLTGSDHFVDLYHFARLIRGTIAEPGVEAAAQRVMDAVDGSDGAVVRHRRQASGVYDHIYMDLNEAHGLSIYLPLGARDWLLDYYNGSQLSFAADTAWDELVVRLVAAAQPPDGPDPALVDPDRRAGPLDAVRPLFVPVAARGAPLDAIGR